MLSLRLPPPQTAGPSSGLESPAKLTQQRAHYPCPCWANCTPVAEITPHSHTAGSSQHRRELQREHRRALLFARAARSVPRLPGVICVPGTRKLPSTLCRMLHDTTLDLPRPNTFPHPPVQTFQSPPPFLSPQSQPSLSPAQAAGLGHLVGSAWHTARCVGTTHG